MARKMHPTNSPTVLELRWAYEDGSSPNSVRKFPRPSKRFDTVRDDCRQRRAHRKVRTGCLTCKIRRKKCDEAKPECQRCRTTGRVCDGYSSTDLTKAATPQPVKEFSPSSSSSTSGSSFDMHFATVSSFKWSQRRPTYTRQYPAPLDHLSRSPNCFAALGPLTDVDRHCFTYFYHRTTPQFTSYFEAIIWRSSSMRGIHHPALFSAAVALGAVHRRFCYGISREGLEYCAHADRLYKKSLRQLDLLKDQKCHGEHSDQDDHIFVVECLLGMFQAFQGEPDAATDHMHTALYHFLRGRPLNMIRSERRYCLAKCKPNIFCKLFHQLYCRLTELLDSPIRTLVKTRDGRPLPSIPSEFQSLEEARDFLFTEVDWITHTPDRWEELSIRSHALRYHVSRLTEWSHAYTKTVKTMTRTTRQKRACTFMKLARNASYLLMFWTLFADAETYLPSPLPDLEDDHDEDDDQVLKTATEVMRAARTRLGRGNANLADVKLMVEALLEHKAIRDVADNKNDHNDDDNLDPTLQQSHYPSESSEVGVYTVANQITLTADTILFKMFAALLPEHMDVTLPDITCLVEERMLLLRYYRPHPDGVGLWWTQEWWTF